MICACDASILTLELSKCKYALWLNTLHSANNIPNRTWIMRDRPLTIPKSLIKEIDNQIKSCYATAETYFGQHFKRPSISLSLTGKVAGCVVGSSHMNINGVMLLNYGTEFVTSIIPHEVAHLIDTTLNGNTAHGLPWQYVMSVLDCDPNQYHTFESTNRSYVYHCIDCNKEVELSRTRHNRTIAGAEYACCTTPLIFNAQATFLR